MSLYFCTLKSRPILLFGQMFSITFHQARNNDITATYVLND